MATLTSGTVICALIAAVAIVSTGYRAEQLDLGDGAVWVVNESRQAVGRANTQVFELNAGVVADSSQIDVLQEGESVLLVDAGQSSIDIIDRATTAVTESVPLPPGVTDVALAGGRVSIAADGDFWLVPVDDLSSFDAASDPTLSLGTDAIGSVDPSGDLFVFSPTQQEMYRIASDEETVSETTSIDVDASADEFQLSSVGSTPVLLDASTGQLFLSGTRVDLPAGSDPVLPLPTASGSTVLVGVDSGLISVPVTGGETAELVGDLSGAPVRPVSVGDCDYAAWADGTVFERCAGDRDLTQVSPAGGARLEFRQNGSHVVLNDAVSGAAWAVQDDNQLIDNWDELIDVVDDEQKVDDNQEDTPPEYEQAQLPPTAVDDEFGARPGTTSPLPVLLNDTDPNGDVLIIQEFTTIDDAAGRLELVNNAQQLQVTLAADATGEFGFDYTISDGRGGTSTATVSVTVRSANENSPPAQVRPSKASVHAGGRLTAQTLGDWFDPDGDPFYLTQASVAAPDQVQFTPDGTIIYTDAGEGGTLREIGLVVSDGVADGAGGFSVTVYPVGEVPIIAEPFPVLAYAGQEVVVSPLVHVRGGSGPLRLVNVPARDGATITADYGGGTFRFESSEIRTHYLEYAVTDGNRTQTGSVRVEVVAPPDAGLPPVTVPHAVYIREQSTERVDVLSRDFDPAGGVLVVTGVLNVPADSGLRVEILEQRIIRVSLTMPLDGPVSFNYTVSNGTATSQGTVTVIEIPTPTVRQPPVAYPDSVSVRVGDAIDIPVLANDTHPDGDTLALDPTLSANVPSGGGLLFTSGRVLRYLAPDKPGNFTATYRAVAPDGQWADAQVTLNVREEDAASNAAPVPKTVVARVLSGERVRVTIPLSGIDPDGDSVMLIGQSSNPEKGSVVGVGDDWFDYEAGAYSTGTDQFEYTVIDALGKQATGTVRVGISSKLDGSRVPIAVADEVTTRPDRTVAVQVLANDSDPDGGILTVTSVEPTTEGASATVDGDLVRVTVPDAEGRFGFIYEIENAWGNTSTNFITVVTRDDAPLARPVASDVVLSLDDILERSTVDVSVLSRVFFADGAASSLRVSLPLGTESAQVTDSKRVRVSVTNDSQIIPFRVSRPDDDSVSAIAFIRVPGLDDALPQLRTGVRPLTVVSGSPLTIDINAYVVAVGNRPVRLTDAATVRASHANGAELVTDSGTITYTSAERYFGPASVSFEVTDGSSATDPEGRVATIVLPIDVQPRDNQPPVFAGGTIDFEPGQEKVIDLTKLTTYPYADDVDELAYSILDPRPAGFSASLSGQRLTLTADESVPIGATPGILIGVRDAVNDGAAGRITLSVVPSTRPLAVPATDTAVVTRGTTTAIDVLDNDAATNPFPSTPLRVVAVRGIDGGLPAGVTVTPNADNSRLSVTVSADAPPGDATLQYQVADATRDPSRFAWGTVQISVQDRPDPVTGLRVTGFGNGTVTLAWEPGAANNSPLTGFSVEMIRSASGTSLGTTPCATTTCAIRTPGNGSDNAVRFAVTANNAIGSSDAQRLADPVWSDVIPPAPTGLSAAPLDGGLRLSWNAVSAGDGSAVQRYAITVGGQSRGEVSAATVCAGTRCSYDVSGLPNGSAVPFSVSARNDAYPALSTWNAGSGEGTPYGPPSAGNISISEDPVSEIVGVSWGPFAANGDPIAGYYVQMLSSNDAPSPCTVSLPAPGVPSAPGGANAIETRLVGGGTTSTTFTGVDPSDSSYYFIVWGFNRAGCVSTEIRASTVRPTPAPVTDVIGSMDRINDATEYDYLVTGVSSGSADFYQISVAGAEAWSTFSGTGVPRSILGLSFGQTVSFDVRACNQWGGFTLCGASHTEKADGVSISLVPQSLSWDAATATWTWTADPPNGASYPASYSCAAANDSTIIGVATPNSCSLSAVPADGQASITVAVNGQSHSYFAP
ncbi:MAG: Ig-like domain-containing protein [Mycetocola sp.]